MGSSQLKSRSKTLLYRLVKRAGLLSLVQSLTASGVRILCYHGISVSDESRFEPILFMDVGTFADRVARLQCSGLEIVPLREVLREHSEGCVRPNQAVITFDDGWHGTFAHGLPILRDYGFPATIYVTSYYVDRDEPVFNICLRYLLWKGRHLTLEMDGLAEELSGRVSPATPKERLRIIRILESAAEDLPVSERLRLLAAVAERLGQDPAESVYSRRFTLVTGEELASLKGSGVDIQLHTHRHRFNGRSREESLAEISDNRRSLVPFVDRALEHFCYPGGEFQYPQKAWLCEAGTISAVTTRSGYCYRHTDPLELPRFLDDESLDPLVFEAELTGIMEIARQIRSSIRIGNPKGRRR